MIDYDCCSDTYDDDDDDDDVCDDNEEKEEKVVDDDTNNIDDSYHLPFFISIYLFISPPSRQILPTQCPCLMELQVY